MNTNDEQISTPTTQYTYEQVAQFTDLANATVVPAMEQIIQKLYVEQHSDRMYLFDMTCRLFGITVAQLALHFNKDTELQPNDGSEELLQIALQQFGTAFAVHIHKEVERHIQEDHPDHAKDLPDAGHNDHEAAV